MKKVFMLTALLCSAMSYANVRLPKLVGNNMVLQRNAPIRIWGWADKNETITVSFMNKQYKATAKDSAWQIMLPAMAAGGPYEMKIKGNNEIVLKNILIGEVWLCSGQSNMGFLMMNTSNAKEEIPKASYNNIRLFTIKKNYSNKPLQDVEDAAVWETCSPSSIPKFSAVAYFYGRKLHEDLKVPVGLIWSAYGGTTIESWISKEGLAGEATFGDKAARIGEYDLQGEEKKNNDRFNQWIVDVNKADKGNKEWAASFHADWNNIQLPGSWDKGTVLKGKDGIAWYQKEIQLTAADLTKDASLSLGTIADEDYTFINGKEVGHRFDERNGRRNYAVNKSLLKEGSNIITVRVTNYRDDGGFTGKPEELFLQTANTKIALGNEWKYTIGADTVVPTGLARTINTRQIPCILYNAMIAPATPYTTKGVLWYQGESNAPRGFQYRYLFERLINDWRKKYNNATMPFVFVQLPNYKKVLSQPADAEWAETRESQAVALKLNNTAMACAIDQGEANDIHPKYKNEVGRRLALQAEYNVYNRKNMIPSGPVYKSMQIKGNQVLITFSVTGKGLQTTDKAKAIKGFAIAGEDKKFVWADAIIINGTTIAVSATAVAHPVAVRYAWADNPGPLNLSNETGIPACPFRTDIWKTKTDGVNILDYSKGAVQ